MNNLNVRPAVQGCPSTNVVLCTLPNIRNLSPEASITVMMPEGDNMADYGIIGDIESLFNDGSEELGLEIMGELDRTMRDDSDI